jgi:filamentous hemagglutinin family protein
MRLPSRFRLVVRLGLLAFAAVSARAQLPTGAQVVAGQAAITQAGNAMTITQASRNAIVNWQSFNLGAENTLRLRQSGADAAMLARVVGRDPSQLLGSLKADGKLFLINPHGILVGAGARIDTAAFLASTLDITDDDFLRGGGLTLKGAGAAGIVNLGSITAREGSVMLFAHTVKNAGEINAPKGTAGLGAGSEVYLASPDTSMFVIRTSVPATPEKTGVENTGVIAAAQAQLEAAGGSLYELAVNQSGIVRATGSATVNGRVLLTAAGGTVGVSGETSARNADGSGGEILVGGDYRGRNAAVANAARTVVTTAATLDASASTASAAAGRVIVWADDATRFLGTLDAHGHDGGFAEVSGKRFLDFNPAATVRLGAGGTLLLDPDALVISTSANAGTSTSGTNPFTFGAATEPATLNVTTLQNQLAASNVILDTSTSTGDITFNDAVTWTTDNSLTVKSGNNINLNASLTGGAGSTLALYTGPTARAPLESGQPDINGEANLDSAATIAVGKLIYGVNGDANPGAGYTRDTPAGNGTFFADGNLKVGTLELDLTHGSTGVSTDGTDNTIGAFKAAGAADFSAYVVNHHGDLAVTLNSTQVDGGTLQFFTPGNLTLKSGSNLNFTRAGKVILASTAGAFVNEAGADVFGDQARYFIYTSTSAATTKDGLTGAEVFNHAYSDSDDYTGLTSTIYYRAASGSPLLTYTADDLIRRYGAANPTLTYTVTGWKPGVTNDVTGAPALSVAATQNSGVGSYAIGITAGTLASSNYDFGFTAGTLSVTRAPLTITASDATRRVGVANPAFNATYSGFVLGQDASALGGALVFSTPATMASIAGAYTITPSGLTSDNYNLTFVPGTLTLNATANLLITANDFSRTYGATNPAFTASYSGFVGGEGESIVTGLQFSTEATQQSGIGSYLITPFGATATGYDISYASGTLEITRAPLTISVPNQSRVYGDANAFTVNYNGLVNGEQGASVVSGLSLATAATAASNVGNYAITASGANADNYSITYSQGTLTVTPAPLTVSIDTATRRYGDADPAFTYQVAGLKNSDSAAAVVNVGAISSTASADSGIGSYGLLAYPSVLSPNYSVAARVNGTFTITPRPLIITADNATRVYGDPNPAFTATFAGLASFDTPATLGALSFSTQATQSSGVGDWGITFATVVNPNYAITSKFGTLTITPAPLTFEALTDLSRVYGRANPAMPLPVVAGLKNSDTPASLGLAFDAPALNADAGTYTYRLTTTNPNYEPASGTGLFRITPAPLTVAITPTGRLYGDANPATYEFTANGLAFGQSAASVLSINNPASLYSGAGVYTLIPVLNTGNYTVTSVTGGRFQVNPRVVTLDLPYYARYYGDPNPVLFNEDIIVGGDGLASFDSISSLVPELHTAVPTTSLSNTGYYRIDPTFAANPNYRYAWSSGYLAIMPRPVEITVGDGVSFGNNNVPADFDADALGVSLVTFDDAHLSGTGYAISMSNPAPGADLAELLRHVKIVLSKDNTPQAVHAAVALDQVPFPPRPNRTPPVGTDEPAPEDDLGVKTIQLSQYVPPAPATPSTVEELLQNVVFSGGQFIVDFTGKKKDQRFADTTRYLLAEPSLGGNYVVTAIHNGKLTMKADPLVVQHTLDTEAAYQRVVDARNALLNGVATTGGAVQHTFGLPRDEFPLIQEAFANLLFDLVRSDRSNPLLQELTGLSSVVSMDQISPDAIVLWLADIHTNPYKQRMLMPAMAAYGVKIAGLSPAQRTPLQQQLVDRMAPSLKAARNDLIDRAVAAHDAWGKVQYGNTNMTTLTGAEVPYEKFVSSAVQQTMESAYNFKQYDQNVLSETDMTKMIGLAAAGTGGATTGAVMAKIAMHSIEDIFPKIRSALSVAADKGDEALVLALKASKYARMGNTANAVFGIVSTAVTVGIEKAIAVANEGVQKEKFEALVASRNDPIDPHALTDTDQGRAVLLAGLMTMFGG